MKINLQHKCSGITLMEMVISSVILFMVTLIVGQLLISGLAYSQRTKSYSTAAILGANATEQELASLFSMPIPAGLSNYQKTRTVTYYNEYLNLVTLKVTAPDGIKSEFSYFSRVYPNYPGVTTPYGKEISISDDAGRDVKAYDASAILSPLPLKTSPDYPTFPYTTDIDPITGATLYIYGMAGGIAQDSNSSVLWAVDRRTYRLYKADNTTSSTPSWNSLSTNTRTSISTAAAIDSYGKVLWVGSAYTRGISSYNTGTGIWGDIVTLPTAGIPAGVATDINGDHVYVANSEHYVQIYDTNNNTWSNSFKPLPGGTSPANMLRGIAVTGYGQIIWVADTNNLYQCKGSVNISCTSVALPLGLQRAGASITVNDLIGMSVDQNNSSVWLHKTDGSLWVYDVSAWPSSSYTKVL